MGERKRTNNNLQDTTHKKLKIEQHESHKKTGMNSGTSEGAILISMGLFCMLF